MSLTFKNVLDMLSLKIIEKLKVLEQNKIWHPEIYVYNHMELVYEEVVKRTPDDDEMIICSVFHDLGKIDTTFLKPNGVPTSPGHEKFAKEYIDKYVPKCYNIDRIKNICYYHMKAHLYKNGEMNNPKKRKAFEELPYFEDIMKFEICDEEGTLK